VLYPIRYWFNSMNRQSIQIHQYQVRYTIVISFGVFSVYPTCMYVKGSLFNTTGQFIFSSPAHKVMWNIVIALSPTTPINSSYFHLCLKNHWTKWSQSWQKWSDGHQHWMYFVPHVIPVCLVYWMCFLADWNFFLETIA
jgi:hypothetical protein